MKVKQLSLLILSLVCARLFSIAQTNLDGSSTQYNTITTAVPFMRISPDARSGAMGDVGIALSPDANAQFWNVSKLAMSAKQAGASLTYTPWLKDLVPDIFLFYGAGYFKFGEKDNLNQAVSIGMRYFSLGDINYTDINAQPIGTGKPREFALDLGYSRKLSENLSIGLSGKFINSNIINGAGNTGGVTFRPGNAFGVDFGMFYTKSFSENPETGQASSINAGLAITNLGSKISYSNDRKDFIPTNLGLGVAYNYNIDEFNKLTFAIDANKLLVPSPLFREDSLGNKIQYYPFEKSVMSGVFGSFGDAPGGMKDELQEVMLSLGAEYSYQNQFFVRAGYFYESKYKGDRRFLTVGAGLKYSMFGINFAYLVPSGSGINRNPLSNTLRFSLLFDFDDLGKIISGSGGDKKKNDKKKSDKKDDKKK
jgi:hypothetical protein